MNFLQANIDLSSSNELSLLAGLIITLLFYIQYKKYQAQNDKDEMIDKFLNP